MKRSIITIVVIGLLALMTSCRHNESVPDNVIDTATMAAIMTEYYLIEGYNYMIASRHPDSLGYQPRAAKDSLLRKYHISQADYDSSLVYYIQHPKVIDEIYTRVLQTLESKKDISDSRETAQQ